MVRSTHHAADEMSGPLDFKGDTMNIGRPRRGIDQTTDAQRFAPRRLLRGSVPAFAAIGAATAIGLLLASLASAMGVGAWQNAQVCLTYPLYKPTVTLGLKQTAFKLLPCGT